VYSTRLHVCTRASLTDILATILARKSARVGQVSADNSARISCVSGSWQAECAAARRLPREMSVSVSLSVSVSVAWNLSYTELTNLRVVSCHPDISGFPNKSLHIKQTYNHLETMFRNRIYESLPLVARRRGYQANYGNVCGAQEQTNCGWKYTERSYNANRALLSVSCVRTAAVVVDQ